MVAGTGGLRRGQEVGGVCAQPQLSGVLALLPARDQHVGGAGDPQPRLTLLGLALLQGGSCHRRPLLLHTLSVQVTEDKVRKDALDPVCICRMHPRGRNQSTRRAASPRGTRWPTTGTTVTSFKWSLLLNSAPTEAATQPQPNPSWAEIALCLLVSLLAGPSQS